VRTERVTVLGNGSVCGVDVQRFQPNPLARAKVRNALKIADSAVVALYLGRLNRDKGIPELSTAFGAAAARSACELHLLLVGPDEQEMRSHVLAKLADWPGRIHFIDYTDEPETYMASADFFVLPSHREGFGSTIIEAAACGLAAIATRIYGLTDAVVDGKTGVLVKDHDSDALTAAMLSLADDRSLRLALGTHAMERVHAQFRQEQLVSALREFYAEAYPVQDEAAHGPG
jgi:glycosyltransferase involved in cell wall biosynthesis